MFRTGTRGPVQAARNRAKKHVLAMISSEQGSIFDADSVSSAVKAMPRVQPSAQRPLSPTALLVAAQDFKPAYSPIVLAGTVRLIEASLVALVGLALYFWYVVPANGFAMHYIAEIAGIAILSIVAFQ